MSSSMVNKSIADLLNQEEIESEETARRSNGSESTKRDYEGVGSSKLGALTGRLTELRRKRIESSLKRNYVALDGSEHKGIRIRLQDVQEY